jgi:hypothetical protein
MKKVILTSLLIFLMLFVSAQAKSVGYLYTLETGLKETFQYSISTAFSNGTFQTIYKLFKPGTTKARYTITASHFKIDKKMVVEVNDEQYLLSVMNGKEEVTYDTETLQPFGIRGNMAIFDKSAPNQLSVQFVSGRFEYVRVINFLGSYSDNIFQFFLFNKNDKISEPKESIIDKNESKVPKAKFNPPAQKDSITNKLFTGTKTFCDAEKVWKYEVTIMGDSIILKLFPGITNNQYKNKTIPREIVRGVVRNSKIVTKDPPEYLTNRFKYEGGILFEVNNEGDYNDYPECK